MRRRWQGKGRPLDDAALAEIRALLGTMPRRRDLLIEMLHRIQDRFGALHARHLRALAEEMRLAEAEIHEVASFYHHFDIVKEGEAPPPPVTIRVCDSLSCMLAGAESLLAALDGAVDPARIRVLRAPCLGRCDEAPAALVGHHGIGRATAEALAARALARETDPALPAGIDLAAYRAGGGYRLLEACRAGIHTPESLIEALSESGLRGLGGAGFPAGRKWRIVRGFAGPRLMTINADEGEPGTFKDRHHLARDPHRVLEGALIAAHVVGCARIYLYLRDEYPEIRALLAREVAALDDCGLTAPCPIEIRRGAGAYICGEESAMLESIEGRRGLPRHRPPYIAERGLFGRPTLNHNVETLFWLRDILENGAGWFARQGMNGAAGLRSYSVSGRVRMPGLRVAPAGITARALIEEHCGGMAQGHNFVGYLPGGASGGILPARLADLPLDFGRLDEYGCFVGSHAVIVFSDQDDPRVIACNLLAFFAAESCGQCTPCRLGTLRLGALLDRAAPEPGLLADLDHVMRLGSICGLGQAAPNPVASLIRFFPEALGLPHVPEDAS
ncbi:NAD(P)H-dependent oxidoreductase subunit E [Rhabdaerophilum calidifontis]|uniref:NAD(P)H-dependent oxidoreductase subunit E n=1 Tax=Rhabdaerophilum calidifontis TaxID=2604328 RepID=UPI001FE51612|nr:NAD(P)H-dependent oxidoreductase subunit E [Rhabdaerophilum calidifontis]